MTEPGKTTMKTTVPREQREAAAELQARLAAEQCPHCATVGLWSIETTAGRVRYIKCGACGKYAKLVTQPISQPPTVA